MLCDAGEHSPCPLSGVLPEFTSNLPCALVPPSPRRSCFTLLDFRTLNQARAPLGALRAQDPPTPLVDVSMVGVTYQAQPPLPCGHESSVGQTSTHTHTGPSTACCHSTEQGQRAQRSGVVGSGEWGGRASTGNSISWPHCRSSSSGRGCCTLLHGVVGTPWADAQGLRPAVPKAVTASRWVSDAGGDCFTKCSRLTDPWSTDLMFHP